MIVSIQSAGKGDKMTEKKHFCCPIDATISLIGGKYKTKILWNLVDQTLRFNELQKVVHQATPKMLTQQLRELERDGLITRTVYPVVPPKTEYALTSFGQSLYPILDAMCEWGKDYMSEDDSSGLPEAINQQKFIIQSHNNCLST